MRYPQPLAFTSEHGVCAARRLQSSGAKHRPPLLAEEIHLLIEKDRDGERVMHNRFSRVSSQLKI